MQFSLLFFNLNLYCYEWNAYTMIWDAYVTIWIPNYYGFNNYIALFFNFWSLKASELFLILVHIFVRVTFCDFGSEVGSYCANKVPPNFKVRNFFSFSILNVILLLCIFLFDLLDIYILCDEDAFHSNAVNAAFLKFVFFYLNPCVIKGFLQWCHYGSSNSFYFVDFVITICRPKSRDALISENSSQN